MTIAFACECFEKGIITAAGQRRDRAALRGRAADAQAARDDRPAGRLRRSSGRGIGPAGGRWGVSGSAQCLCVKGQELALHDRGSRSVWGMSYALCTYGADHMNTPHDPSFVDSNSFALKSVNALGIYRAMPATQLSNDKVRSFVILENFWRMLDSLGLCVFGFAPRGVMPLDTLVACIKAATGWEVSLHDLMQAAERSSMLARAFQQPRGVFHPGRPPTGAVVRPEAERPQCRHTHLFRGRVQNRSREILCHHRLQPPDRTAVAGQAVGDGPGVGGKTAVRRRPVTSAVGGGLRRKLRWPDD